MSFITADLLNLSSGPAFIGSLVGLFTGSNFSAGIYAFGDSLADAGNDFILTLNQLPASPPYVRGHFTNGQVWVQDLAARLGLPAVHASLSGGTDFAYGGAETGREPLHSRNYLDLPSQLKQFEGEVPHPNPNAIYSVSAGSNDVLDAVSEWSADPNKAINDVGAAVNNLAGFVFELVADGAKNVVLMNVPDLGKTPLEMAAGAVQSAVASSLAFQFDADLRATMRAVAADTQIDIHVVNAFKLMDKAIADPSRFGLTNVIDPVWTGNYTDPNSGTLASTNGAVQNQYLFWDQLHPTAHGHDVLAAHAAHSVLG